LIFATRGDEALEVWKPRHAEISLLITDVMMPGMRGPDLIQRMRVDRPDLPVICTSGYSDSELPDRGTMPAGVVFLEKPFSPKALRERVQSLLPR
jgi:two-component system cell cycle sensor histidine kinase/response regulator CckA